WHDHPRLTPAHGQRGPGVAPKLRVALPDDLPFLWAHLLLRDRYDLRVAIEPAHRYSDLVYSRTKAWVSANRQIRKSAHSILCHVDFYDKTKSFLYMVWFFITANILWMILFLTAFNTLILFFP